MLDCSTHQTDGHSIVTLHWLQWFEVVHELGFAATGMDLMLLSKRMKRLVVDGFCRQVLCCKRSGGEILWVGQCQLQRHVGFCLTPSAFCDVKRIEGVSMKI